MECFCPRYLSKLFLIYPTITFAAVHNCCTTNEWNEILNLINDLNKKYLFGWWKHLNPIFDFGLECAGKVKKKWIWLSSERQTISIYEWKTLAANANQAPFFFRLNFWFFFSSIKQIPAHFVLCRFSFSWVEVKETHHRNNGKFREMGKVNFVNELDRDSLISIWFFWFFTQFKQANSSIFWLTQWISMWEKFHVLSIFCFNQHSSLI